MDGHLTIGMPASQPLVCYTVVLLRTSIPPCMLVRCFSYHKHHAFSMYIVHTLMSSSMCMALPRWHQPSRVTHRACTTHTVMIPTTRFIAEQRNMLGSGYTTIHELP